MGKDRSVEQPIQLRLKVPAPSESRPGGISFQIAFLGIASLPGLGCKGLAALVDAFGENLGRIWDEDRIRIEEILRRARGPQAQTLATRLHQETSRLLDQGQMELERLAARGVRMLAPTELPPALREIPDGPRWLFVEGNPEVLKQKPMVAVVGTRQPSEKGQQAARIVTELLAAYPIVLVSGLAEGIDATAHEVSLQEDVLNVAFLGHGIDIVFPRATAHLRRRIVEQGGVVATEYLPGERYDRGKFVARNRLQAALADLMIPVEGRLEGGTAHTVRFAQCYSRPLLGLRWEGADGLVEELARIGVELVNPFTLEGQRRLDERLRALAHQAGRSTWALRRVGRLLEQELKSRMVRSEDLEALSRQIASLHIQTEDPKDDRGEGFKGDSI